MYTTTQFMNKFSDSKIRTVFFNEYNGIIEAIDRLLSDVEVFDVTEECRNGGLITYRCEVNYMAPYHIPSLMKTIAEEYKKGGWLVVYNEHTNEFLFQTFVSVNAMTGEFILTMSE